MSAPDINDTIAARDAAHGGLDRVAYVSQAIKAAFADSNNRSSMPDDMCEALDMIAHKLARILTGDMDNFDSWHDVAGYATCVANRLAA